MSTTVQKSTAVRNAILDVEETTIGTSAKIQWWSGTKPATCANVDTGNKLAEFSLASDWAAAASGGSKSLSGLPVSTTGIMAGTVSYYRKISSGGTCHEQGDVSQSADAWATSTAYAVGKVIKTAANKVYVCTTGGTSAGSGAGMTTSGSGITDGTCVWNYQSDVGAAEINNPVIAEDQPLTIDTWTQVAAGA